MAKNFNKISKTKGTPRIRNSKKDRAGMVKDENTGDDKKTKKALFQIKYTTPIPFSSEFPIKDNICVIDKCHIRAILQCDVRLDGEKTLKSVILCPYRGKTLKTLLFKFDVKKFYLAEVDIIKSVGICNEN